MKPQSEALPNTPTDKQDNKHLLYEKPAIIHSGVISTRAGSPTGLLGGPEDSVVDPADLFGTDGS